MIANIGVIPLPAAKTAIRLKSFTWLNLKLPFACETSKFWANGELLVIWVVKAPFTYVLINKCR